MLTDPAAAVQLSPVESHESEEYVGVEQKAVETPKAATGEGKFMGDTTTHTESEKHTTIDTDITKRSKPELAAMANAMEEMLMNPVARKSKGSNEGPTAPAEGANAMGDRECPPPTWS